MRPRKKVLIFSGEEIGAAHVVFAINTRGMHARAVCTAADFVEQVGAFDPDAALLFYDGEWSAAPVRACERAACDRHIPSIVAVRCRGRVEPSAASMTLQLGFAGMAEILEMLRVLSQRRRGPRKADSATGQRYVEAGRAAVAANARLA